MDWPEVGNGLGRLVDGGVDLAFGEAGADFLRFFCVVGIVEDRAGLCVGGDGVAAVEGVLGAEETEALG